jgi:hypothetical protein
MVLIGLLTKHLVRSDSRSSPADEIRINCAETKHGHEFGGLYSQNQSVFAR